MGLDIFAISHVQPVPPHTYDEELCEGAGHAGTIEARCYVRTADSQEIHFRAGSYSGYNWWREQLCRFALGVEPQVVWETAAALDAADPILHKPFMELINFSDCEGIIGPELSAKLAQDFAAHQDGARRYAATMGHIQGLDWMEKYSQWCAAFELAAHGGFVEFY